MANLGFIGNTDQQWFEFLRNLDEVEEVNFWQPGAPRNFRAVPPGAPFFLRLKAPHRVIGGMGFFARYVQVPIGVAWDSFGVMNGAPTEVTWRAALAQYRKGSAADGSDELGCIMLFRPVFFPQNLWVKQPENWHDNVVTGAGIDVDAGEGKRIFDECMQNVLRMGARPSDLEQQPTTLLAGDGPRFGAPYLTQPRLGQRAFQMALVSAYDRACAVTGEHTLPVLEAAHIRPYAGQGAHAVPNGLLLRADVHKLFDAGYVTVTPDYEFVVSRYVKERFANGKIYYERQGKIFVPKRAEDRPDKVALQWHNEVEFEKFAR